MSGEISIKCHVYIPVEEEYKHLPKEALEARAYDLLEEMTNKIDADFQMHEAEYQEV